MPSINTILRKPEYQASSARGASMGRSNQRDGEPEKLCLEQLLMVDGDYDVGGAYWGGGCGSDPMWCGFSPYGSKNDPPIMIFVRGATRRAAKKAVLAEVKEEGFSFFK